MARRTRKTRNSVDYEHLQDIFDNTYDRDYPTRRMHYDEYERRYNADLSEQQYRENYEYAESIRRNKQHQRKRLARRVKKKVKNKLLNTVYSNIPFYREANKIKRCIKTDKAVRSNVFRKKGKGGSISRFKKRINPCR